MNSLCCFSSSPVLKQPQPWGLCGEMSPYEMHGLQSPQAVGNHWCPLPGVGQAHPQVSPGDRSGAALFCTVGQILRFLTQRPSSPLSVILIILITSPRTDRITIRESEPCYHLIRVTFQPKRKADLQALLCAVQWEECCDANQLQTGHWVPLAAL